MTEALTDPTFPADVITPPVRKAILDLVSGYLDMVGASVDVNQQRSLEPIISDGRIADLGDGYMMTLTVHIRAPQPPKRP